MRFVRLFRYDPVKDPTARLRLDYEPEYGNAVLSDENVFPEQAENADARCVETLASLQLTTACVRWLATETAALADVMERSDAEIQAWLDARRNLGGGVSGDAVTEAPTGLKESEG